MPSKIGAGNLGKIEDNRNGEIFAVLWEQPKQGLSCTNLGKISLVLKELPKLAQIT